MLRTPVPEATMDEDRYLCPREHEIRAPSETAHRFVVDPETKTSPMQHRAKSKFGAGVTGPIRSHR